MEDRTESSHGTGIPKKSRSLDLKSLYETKVTNETLKNSLKRKGSSSHGRVDEKRNKKKKTRKEVSLNSLENAEGCSKKKVDEECHVGQSSHKQDSSELKLGVSQRLNNSSGLSRVSLNLDDDGVHIPKRKRGFVGRKKSEVGQGPHLAGQSIGKGGLVSQLPKPCGVNLDRGFDSLKIRQKKHFDEFKENRSSDSTPVQHFKRNEDHACHSIVNSGDLPLKKSRRKDRKRKVLAPDSKSIVNEAEPLMHSGKIGDDLQEDDEENLEENAARMLSSRFDPSCTGFSSSNKSSTTPSANGLSFLISSDQNHVSRKSQSSSESASVDTAVRVLRPRKEHREKGKSRKRRHFYEISLGELDADWVLNRRIKVFWPLDQSWYYGLVGDYDREKKLHHIKYDDRDEEWINLQTERFKLLLLPSEVRGNASSKRTVKKSKNSNEQNGSVKSKKVMGKREQSIEDDSCGGSCMDSEPIISWLARSSNRVKSSPFHSLKKQKTSATPPNLVSPSMYDESVRAQGYLAGSSFWGGKSNMSSGSVLQDKLGDCSGGKSLVNSATCPRHGKLPIVYSRRRFRRPNPAPEEGHFIRSAPHSAGFDPVAGGIGDVEKNDPGIVFRGPLVFTHSMGGVSKITLLDIESAAFIFDLSYPIHVVLNNSFESENFWLVRAILLLHCGTVMTMWPRVNLEMLFVDNVVGLRFLLFEGCLKMAAAFVFLVLRLFHESADKGKNVDFQLPVTSIRFKFSCVHDIKKQLVFAFYNFTQVKNSKWMYLDSKLRRYCLLSKQLHLSECTYDNIQALQNGSSEFHSSPGSGRASSFEVTRKRTRMGISIMGVSKESTKVDMVQFSDVGKRKLPPFALCFAAAPTFFLTLHLKLLMERSVSHISFHGHAPRDDLENSVILTHGCSCTDDCSDKNLEMTLKTNMMTSSKDPACDESEPLIGFSACSNDTLLYHNIGHNDAGASGSQSSDITGTTQLHKWQSPDSGSEPGSLPMMSPRHRDESNDGSPSFMNNLSVRIPSVDQIEKPMDVDLHVDQHSSDLPWNMNEVVIPSPKSTAPRSSGNQNRNNSSSLGLLSHGWSDGKADSFNNGFSTAPKKPRTQVSYSLPFGGYDFSSRLKSHHQKGFPHRRIRKANEKKSSDVARGLEKNLESLSCEVNVLITVGDKGWRESGAQVVLELFDHNEWKLSVKLAGVTRYSYKAHQFLQPGSTNRYTHAMMWKGGKDWILEFPDRSQWALFKEMHEECYNRNIRAASVKNIPIPGVCLIEENDDSGLEVTFVRSSKYFRQIETDVDMALNPSCVLYDMDSDDEQWIMNVQNSETEQNGLERISEMFEKTMDIFEKAAYDQQRSEFSPDEIEELMADVGSLGLAKTIYEHWHWRRQKKGMALIRHFQPPLWERYQQQLREWEVSISKNNSPVPNGCLDKAANVEKPPMFAFCLKPRGLEVPNKGSKQRSQKRFSVSGQTNSILGDQDSLHSFGRRMNGYAYGEEKFTYSGHNYDSWDDSPLPQTSPRVFSPRDASSIGYFSMSNDGLDRNYSSKLHRNKSKKYGSWMYHNDSQMVASHSPRIIGKRNGVHRWNTGYHDLLGHRQYVLLDGPQRHGIEQLEGSDLDEFKLRDASGAAQHAHNVAKLKRERAHRMLYRADLAIHKAVVALMTAEAMKASEDSSGDG